MAIKLQRLTDSLNVLAGIDHSALSAFDYLKAISATLTERNDKHTGDPFWPQGAEDMVFLATTFVVAYMPEEMRNLQTVCEIISSLERFNQVVEAASASPAYGHMMARLANRFVGMNPKELASFRAVANSNLAVLNTPAIAKATTESTFSTDDILTGNTTVYLVLPPEYLKSHGKILRLWVADLLRACVRNGPQEQKLVRFMLDEVAALGQMPEIETLVQAYRGYGVRATFILQNLAQVSKIMSEGQEATLLGNCDQIYFGIRDHKTAKELSDTLGKYTQSIASGNSGWSRSDTGGKGGVSNTWSGGDSWSLAARELATADELMRADPTVAITIAPGKPPILSRLIRYYEPAFRNTGRIGPVRAAIDTAWLFLAALIVTTFNLAVVFNWGK